MDKENIIREQIGLFLKIDTVMIRLSSLRHLEQLTRADLHYIGEIIFRLQQLKESIKRISKEHSEIGIEKFQAFTLDVEAIYWVSFRIIKCLQKLPNFGKSWGGGLTISRIRNEVLEHFTTDKTGLFNEFNLTFPKEGIVYRPTTNNENNKTVFDHLNEFLSKTINKLPDRDDELRALVKRNSIS